MRIHVWTCNRCHDDGGACEMVTEDAEMIPKHCPCDLIASWQEGAE